MFHRIVGNRSESPPNIRNGTECSLKNWTALVVIYSNEKTHTFLIRASFQAGVLKLEMILENMLIIISFQIVDIYMEACWTERMG